MGGLVKFHSCHQYFLQSIQSFAQLNDRFVTEIHEVNFVGDLNFGEVNFKQVKSPRFLYLISPVFSLLIYYDLLWRFHFFILANFNDLCVNYIDFRLTRIVCLQLCFCQNIFDDWILNIESLKVVETFLCIELVE